MPRLRRQIFAALVVVAALTASWIAQEGIGLWWDNGRDTRQSAAADFDYYTLVLSWSPTHCSTPESLDDEHQCARRDGQRYAFVLHGLWPQYENGYPESCRTRERPFVPQPVIDGMLDIMPSKGLIIHEYRKHGTCSGLNPSEFYQLARRFYNSVRIPARFADLSETLVLSPAELIDEIVAANPHLRPDMIAVSCGDPGDRLKDVRICFERNGKPRRCGANETKRKLCRTDRLQIPPVRPKL